MTVISEDEIERRCVAAAFALSLAYILIVIGTNYQAYAPKIDRLQTEQIGQLFLLVVINNGTFLAPVVVLFLIRKFCVLVRVFAIPVLIIFTLRMYHVWQFYWFGVNSMAQQKGDALSWFTLLFDMLSVAIAAPWLFGILFFKLIDGVRRALRR